MSQSIEQKLNGWTGPSSATEQDKQDRTVRMIREAISGHDAFKGVKLGVYTKGSYPNNTNVRSDSDVDVAIEYTEAVYSDEESAGLKPTNLGAYQGIWTPSKLRIELGSALEVKFPRQVDTSGTTAIRVNSSSARVDADLVPCFTYKYYFTSGQVNVGTKTFRTSGNPITNYPAQQLAQGRTKNTATKSFYKQAVRILKRVENAMVADDVHTEVPSYFIECLLFNCPNDLFGRTTWTDTIKALLFHIWDSLEGDEPVATESRWVEANHCKWLFHSAQKWSRQDGRAFAKAAWNYLGLAS